MEIRFKLSAAENSEAVTYLRKSIFKRSWLRRSPFFIYLICSLVATLGFLIVYNFIKMQIEYGETTYITKYALLATLIALIVLILQNYLWAIYFGKKFFIAATSMQSEQIIHIEPDFMVKQVDHCEYRTSWKDIIRLEETSRYIFLFKDEVIADYIPKNIFKTGEELEAFVNILREKLKIGKSLA